MPESTPFDGDVVEDLAVGRCVERVVLGEQLVEPALPLRPGPDRHGGPGRVDVDDAEVAVERVGERVEVVGDSLRAVHTRGAPDARRDSPRSCGSGLLELVVQIIGAGISVAL